MTRDHKIAVFLLATIVALYPWAMNEHESHPKKFGDLKKEIMDIEDIDLNSKKPIQDYNDATKPGPNSGGYDAWKSVIIPEENTEN